MIGFNALILDEKAGGVGVYIKKLVDFLLTQSPNQYRIFIRKNVYEKFYPNNKSRHFVIVENLPKNPILRIPFEFFLWKYLIARYKIKLLHSPISYIPPGVNCRAIVTIHDLRYFYFPETYPKLRGWFLGKQIPRSIKKAVKVISISETTREDILKFVKCDPNKIARIYEGVDFVKNNESPDLNSFTDFKSKIGLTKPYILSVGHLEPRKNYIRLIEAFAGLLSDSPDVQLVIAGKKNWHFEEIFSIVKENNLENKVLVTGFVPDDILSNFYENAAIFINPSIFEGFSFTPLEAMAKGIPVAVSSCAAHKEVLENASIFFDPYSVDEMANAMRQLLSNDNTEMIKGGFEHIQKFKWETCCTKTINLYDELMEHE